MAKKAAMVFGVIFVLIGLLGFVNNPVLGIFAVNMLHNIVHILLGAILLMASKGDGASKALKWVAIIYLIVALIGFFVSGPVLGLIEVNSADNWLHLVLAIILFGVSKQSGMSGNTMQGGSNGMM